LLFTSISAARSRVIAAGRAKDNAIAALLIKPVPVGNSCLIATQDGDERLLKRVKGPNTLQWRQNRKALLLLRRVFRPNKD